ncbi:hypothetical protein C8Q79DRAFT_736818 [Trametes meyenii]|nr:hypothetical protein C8Q79DRAFT_736818 [Trametes meyenii]
MHPCLLSPDIFLHILDFLMVQHSPDFYAGYNQPLYKNCAVARLARTCRAFLEPCLDMLWRQQWTLGPLVMTLPRDAYIEEIWENINVAFPPDPVTTIHIVRPLTKSDWTRFDYYAPRITALGYFFNEYADLEGQSWHYPNTTSREFEVTPSAVHQLRLYRCRKWLLPNLTHLRWNIYDIAYIDHLSMFLSPEVTSLAFTFQPEDIDPSGTKNPGDSGIATILDSLVEICPTATDLEIYPAYANNVVIAAVDFAYDCLRLSGYHINPLLHGPLDRGFLYYLSAQPHLRKVFLSMDAETAEDLSFLTTPSNYHPFPSLQTLFLQVPRLHTFISLVEVIGECRFFSIGLEIEYRPLIGEVYELFDTLRANCGKYTLHTFHLTQEQLHDDDFVHLIEPDHFLGIASIFPLLDFPNIRCCIIDLPFCGWLADEDIHTIADAWPGLITFSFLSWWGTYRLSPATWRGIAYLVTKCTRLTELRITLDATHSYISQDDLAEFGMRPNRYLRFFNFLDSPLPEDPYPFALALFSMAPRVVKVQGIGWVTDPDAPLTHDPYAFYRQVDTMMCRLRRERYGDEYVLDKYAKNDLIDTSDSMVDHLGSWGAWA